MLTFKDFLYTRDGRVFILRVKFGAVLYVFFIQLMLRGGGGA